MFLSALGGTSAFAAAQCQEDVLSSYLVGGFSCSQDNGLFTLKGFTFSGPLGGLTSDQISLSPFDMSGIGFMLNGNFTAAQGQTFSYTLSYFIDPPADYPRRADSTGSYGQCHATDRSLPDSVSMCAGEFFGDAHRHHRQHYGGNYVPERSERPRRAEYLNTRRHDGLSHQRRLHQHNRTSGGQSRAVKHCAGRVRITWPSCVSGAR